MSNLEVGLVVRTELDSKLAIDGGCPVRQHPLPAWPKYSEEEITKATDVLRSGRVNYWTGDECRRFEEEFAAYHGVRHGIALANGTLALELALRVLDIGPGDEVIVTPRSYFASAACIALREAIPVFTDVDPDSQNVTASMIADRITSKTRAVLVVHLSGWPCDMPSIMNLARKHDLRVIEDCAQAHGARFDGQAVGSFGDIAAFSFCQDKIMSTAGEGGMLITDDEGTWERAWSFKDHGKNWRKAAQEPRSPGFRWLHDSIGSNYRMTEVQAAIGRIQLERLEQWVARRRDNAARLIEGLSALDALRVPRPSGREHHAYYKLYTFLKPERLRRGWSRDRILGALQAEGIPGFSGSCPEIYREAAFAGSRYSPLRIARELGETSLMFLVHPTLERADLDDILAATTKVLRAASHTSLD